MTVLSSLHLLLLALFSGSPLNVPLSLPPLPPDPVLASVAPEQCVWYMSLAGVDKANASSKNKVEQLLAEDDVQNLVRKLKTEFKAALAAGRENDPIGKILTEEGPKLVETLLTRPMCIYIGGISPGAHGPTVRGGMVVNLGDDAAATEASLKKVLDLISPLQPGAAKPAAGEAADGWQSVALPADAPTVQWAIKGKYLVVGIGDGEAAAIWARNQKPAPKWLTDIQNQLKIERPSMVQYANLQVIDGMLQMALTVVEGPEHTKDTLETLGLTNAKYYTSVSGLDKQDFASRTMIATDGPPTGIFSLLDGKPLDAEALNCIPADATFAVAARIEPKKMLEELVDVTAMIVSAQQTIPLGVQTNFKNMINSSFDMMAGATGVHPKNDIAANLGDTWCVYNSPTDGGLVITGLTVVGTLNDRQKIVQANDKLIDAYRKQMAQLEAQLGAANANFVSHEPTVETCDYRSQKIYFINFPQQDGSPVSPSWCITDKHFVFGLYPQTIKAFLDRQSAGGKTSLASVPEIGQQFTAGTTPTLIVYQDTPNLFKLMYPLMQIGAQYGFAGLQASGFDVNISSLPSASSILPHLTPSVTSIASTKDGVQIQSQGTLPMGAMGLAALLPAVGVRTVAARQAAGQAQAMNNLKQIGLAMHNHLSASKAFPAAFNTGKDGKPLLSWRVMILPYLEENDLFQQFHLDEPWDSEHNKALIEKMPKVYAAPGSKVADEFKTVYLTPRGEKTAFPGEKAVRIREITDGTSKTLMAVEASDDKAVIWTKPDDYEINDKDPTAGLVGLRRGNFLALFCDGSVQAIPENVAQEAVMALFTRNGGEVVDTNNFPRKAAEAPPNGQVVGNGVLVIQGGAAVPAVIVGGQPLKAAPAFPPGPAGELKKSMNNLKEISLAMMVHHDAKKRFPAAYTVDNSNNKKPLLSWRVAILPFLDQGALYQQFHHDEPWDSENNKKLIEKMPDVFKAPGSKAAKEFKTVYLTPRGSETVFPDEKGVRLKDITDGTSKTIMVVEANDDQAVVWTKPDDFDVSKPDPIKGLVGLRDGEFLAAFCDGSIHRLTKDIDLKTLLQLFDRHDGNVVDSAKFETPPKAPPAAAAQPAQPGQVFQLDIVAPPQPVPPAAPAPAPAR